MYASEAGTVSFHKAVTEDPNVRVSPWKDDRRSVQFSMPANVPSFMSSLIGSASIAVHEDQKVVWSGSTGFVVKVAPTLDFPGSSNFTTSAQVEVVPQRNDSILVRSVVKCSAAVPWPLQGMVEGVMADKAKTSTLKFLEFSRAFYDSAKPSNRAQPALTPVPSQSSTATKVVHHHLSFRTPGMYRAPFVSAF